MGAVNSSGLGSHVNHSLIKSKFCSQMLRPLAFRWLNWKVFHQNNCAWWDFVKNSKCSQIFRRKKSSWESISFHRESIGATIFLIFLCICIVNAIIFIKKNISKLIQDQFLQLVKDHQYEYFCYVDKVMACVFTSSLIKKMLVIPNLRMCVWAY